MSTEEPQSDDESVLTQLVAHDPSLPQGTPLQQPPSGGSATPVDSQPRLEGDLAGPPMPPQGLPRRSTGAMPDSLAPLPVTELPFQQLGRFQIRRLLGQGAFGMVFLADDPQLGRPVALKVPRPEMLLTGQLRERFVREARAAAGLDHPNLVPVYDASAEGPLCYIASAYCPGITLSEWLKQRSELPPVRLAAGLVATLADAVSHAHSRGVIHRDLKPSNILLQEQRRDPADPHSTLKEPGGVPAAGAMDGELIPRITDFGLAKLTSDLTSQPGETMGTATQSGAVVGTPNYMAPEQASGKTREIGPAADLYALGAILYELLTGRVPFRGDSILDTLEQVRTREPLPPSRLRPKLPRDVETICLKCLEKEPPKRYDSAAALAEDLRCYLAGQPIQARPIRAWERGLKWARRKPAQAMLLAVSILAPLLVSAIVLAYNVQLTAVNAQLADTNDKLENRKVELTESNTQLHQALKAKQEALGAEEKQRRRAEERELAARRYSYVSDLNLTQHDWVSARMERLRELLQRQIPPPGALDLRGFEWHYWHRLAHHSDRRTLTGHTGEVWCVACSPDGQLLASGGRDRTLRLWDAATGRELGVLGTFRHTVTAVAFVEGGRTLAAASLGGTVRLWDVAGRKERQTLSEQGPPVLAATGAGQRPLLALARANGDVEIWDREAKAPRHLLRGHQGRVWAVAFSADGHQVVSGDDGGVLRLWDADTGKRLESYPSQQKGIHGVAVSPDGKQLAAACNDATIRLWNGNDHKERLLIGHTGEVWSIQFAPDGQTLVSAGADATVRLWNADGTPRFVLKGHTGEVRGALFTPDGRTIVSAGTDRSLKLWDAHLNPEFFSWQGHDRAVKHLAFEPAGDALATGADDRAVKLWQPVTGQLLAVLPPCPRTIQGLALAPDGKHVAVACADPFVHIYDRQTAQEVGRLPGRSGNVVAVAFSPDDNLLAVGGADGGIRVWDWSTQKTLAEWDGRQLGIRALAFSPDGQLLASSDARGAVKLWQPATGQLRATLIDHQRTVWGLAFSPDGRTLASGGDDSTIRLWEVDSGRLRRRVVGHAGSVRSLAFSPDGRTLASTDGEVKLWQAATGRELAAFTDRGTIFSVAWAPRRLLLAGGGGKGAITLWDADAKGP